MKRVLSLVLVLVLVLGAVMPSFAEVTTAELLAETQDLVSYGIIEGEGNGNMNEAGPLTRAAMAKILAYFYGEQEDASVYAVDASFTDLAEDAWYLPWVGYAEISGWMIGDASGGTFRPNDAMKAQEVNVLMLRVLGYSDVAWEDVNEKAAELEVGVVASDNSMVLRGEAFKAIRTVLDSKKMGSEVTLGTELALPNYVAPVPPVAPVAVVIDSVASLSQTMVELTLEEAVATVPAAEDFVVKNAAGEVVAISNVTLRSEGMRVILTVAEMTSNEIYTVTHNAMEYKFVAIANEAVKPQLTSAVALTNTSVKLTFNENVDENALDIANYAIAGLAVLSAEYDVDANGLVKTDIILTTAVQTSGTIYKVVVTNVTDLVGNVINADNDEYQFGGLAADTTKPQLTSAVALTNTTVKLTFNENVDQATAENIANYAIDGLSVLTAERQTTKSEVILTTVAQTSGTIYKVVVTNVTDMSANVINSSNDEFQFGGLAPDTTKPQLSSAVALTNLKVKLTFNENVDKTTAENIANYTIDGLTIVSAARQTTKSEVVLTTSAQTSGTIYKVVVVNVTDAAGNIIDSSNDEFQFGGMAADTTAPSVVSAVAATATTVKVTFSEVMDSVTAAQAYNYYLGTELGYPTSVVKDTVQPNGTVWVLTTKTQASKVYTVDVTGVKDASGNVLNEDADTATFGGLGTADTTAPQVTSAVALNNQTIKVTFNEKLDSTSVAVGDFTFAVVSGTEGANPIAAQTADALVVASDKMSATLAFADPKVTTSGVVYSVTVATVNDANGNIIGATKNVATFAGINSANAAPAVTSVVAIDNQTLKVTFSEKVTGAENLLFTDFSFSPAYVGALNDAVLASDGLSATYYFDNSAAFVSGTVYTLQVVGSGIAKISDEFGLDALAVKTGQTYAEASFAGVASAPAAVKIAAITAVDVNTLDITFNKQVDLSAVANDWIEAINLSNGTVFANPTVTLTRAEGTDGNKIRVFLGTDNTAFTAGNIYQVKLDETKVVDLNGLAMTTANDNAVFAATSTANAAPKMVSAAYVDANTIEVTFSEAVVLAGLNPQEHFALSTGTVSNAVANGKVVTLTVAGLPASGNVVTITASATLATTNITDEAAVGNASYTTTVKFVVQ